MRSLSCSIIRGSVGFAIVSLGAFSVWALAGKWFQHHGGEGALYGACALVFAALSGLLLHPLVRNSESLLRFYGIFVPAFLAYATVWCLGWFALHYGLGEWLGALLGSAAFVGVLCWKFQNGRTFIPTTLIVFALNLVGYFLGGHLTHWLLSTNGTAFLSGLSKPEIAVVAKLGWGLVYGLGFGAGIGYAFYAIQNKEPGPA